MKLIENAAIGAEPIVSISGAQAPQATAAEVVITFYELSVPSFCREALDKIYRSVFATLDQFEMDNALDMVNTYVERVDGEICTVLLYRINDDMATVLNQAVSLEKGVMDRFSEALFAEHPRVQAIEFLKVQADTSNIKRPFLQFHCGEDIVAPLPATPDEYLASLGKNLRETVKRYTNKITRSFPDFRIHVYIDDEYDAQQIMELYRLHKERILTRNEVSNVTPEIFDKIMAMARKRGLVTVATMNGKVVGGLICWKVDSSYVMRIIAHDPVYDEYKIGTICCYHTIRECIARGGRAFHFMGGRLIYKYRFLGVERDYDQIMIYRTRLTVLRRLPVAARVVIKGLNQEVRLWLQNAERSEDPLARFATRWLQQWRSLKRLNLQRIAGFRGVFKISVCQKMMK
jgi:hypothetical protein